MVERITSRENAHIKAYCKLASSKKYRDASGSFVLEGAKLAEEAYRNKVSIEKVFLTEQAYEKYGEKLFELLNSGVPVWLIGADIAKKMADTENPQGVFAVCQKPADTLLPEQIRPDGVYVALCGLQDPGNVGTIIRTAEALGVDGLLVSADCCDCYSPKVVRGTMGSVFRLPVMMVTKMEDTLRSLSVQGVESYAAVLDETANPLSEISFSGGIAVIGNEGNGLDQSVIDCCDHKMTIQMRGNAESLNAAMAAGIILWEMTRRR